ncbi:MAG: peptide-methionine (S)-S-oxide reductase MsrA [bacterium]|nr:peptide-methionine (S)-S-oxide reductase MsrA [bacterium]
MKTEKATFAAGCFWGVEEAFLNIKGVISTTVGYTGGHLPEPTYEDVCSDKTGHAEAVLVEYNPTAVTYEKLLDVFWKIHDPTQVNKQGPDLGSQYRSAIYFHSPGQEQAALLAKEKLQQSGRYKNKIITEVAPAAEFWPAEEYHQKYLQKKGRTICHF